MIKISGDVEIYPNFFSFVFRTIETNTRKDFIIFGERDDRKALIDFLHKKPLLVGYNTIAFDVPILQALMQGYPVEKLHEFAQKIIAYKGVGFPNDIDYIFSNGPKINTLDLKRILNLDISLKQCAIIMRWPKLQELPFNPMEPVNAEQAKILVEYNDNDSQITRELFHRSTGAILLRSSISKRYQLDVMNAGDSKIANLLIDSMYHKATGKQPSNFKKQRSFRNEVRIADCIGKNIEFVSDKMQSFANHLKSIVLEFETTSEKIHQGSVVKENGTKLKSPFKETVTLEGVTYQLGVGGLHSKDTPNYFKSTDDIIIIDADVASFYPRIILNNKIKPAHVQPIFINKLEELTEGRLKEKAAGNTMNAWALKIVINSIFGKLGSPNFWLYDPLAFYSVTISGQLLLLSLIDRLNDANIDVISANTDGIICKLHKNKMPIYEKICKRWQEHTKYDLEFTKYSDYVRRDVNNYLAITDNGKVKTKGAFDDITINPDFARIAARRYNMPIVTKALRAYYVDGIPVEKFIREADSIFDFLIAQKPGKKFQVSYGGNDVQHVNRFYVSTNGEILYKYNPKEPTRKLSVTVEPVTLLNDVSHVEVEKYPNLDYDYYIRETRKIIRKIQPPVKKNKLF